MGHEEMRFGPLHEVTNVDALECLGLLGKARHALNKAREYIRKVLGCALNVARHKKVDARSRQQRKQGSECPSAAAHLRPCGSSEQCSLGE